MENLTSEANEKKDQHFESGISFENFKPVVSIKGASSRNLYEEEKVFDYRKRVSKTKSNLFKSS